MLIIPIPSIMASDEGPACKVVRTDGSVVHCPYYKETEDGSVTHRVCKMFGTVLGSRDNGNIPTPCTACLKYRTDQSENDGPEGTSVTVELEGGSLTLSDTQGHKSIQVFIEATKTFISIDPQRLLDNYTTGCEAARKVVKENHLKDLLDQIRWLEESGVQHPRTSWYGFISFDTVLGTVGKKLVDGKVVPL
jgi:hypothetical protein